MCGIAGVVSLGPRLDGGLAPIEGMLGALRHRGPDEAGAYRDDRAALGCARLAVIDLDTGTQPIGNEDGTVWIVCNGEVFDHLEWRRRLESSGHRFHTRSDIEVLVHLYEEAGPRCFGEVNGQFAAAIWDIRDPDEPRLVLARDRVGILPMHYAQVDDVVLFASEAKALFAHPVIEPRLDPLALAETFTLWAPVPPRTAFEGVCQLLPGEVAVVRPGGIATERYWSLDFAPEEHGRRRLDDYAEELLHLLTDATRLRLRADVPVAAYLSGGLDSSAVTAIARDQVAEALETFSVTFTEPNFDERAHQDRMVATLGTRHHRVACGDDTIAALFPEVVWHAEAPMLRTSPAPMYLLSSLVRQQGIKVVLTGEGADEFLGGYNLFRETKVRRFWARDPESRLRPLLLARLYPYVRGLHGTGGYLEAFFGRHLEEVDRLDYSHVLRWTTTRALHRLFSTDLQRAIGDYDPTAAAVEGLATHPNGRSWDPVRRAQYLEASVFMAGYLLSSQGDRMLMAHSVEGRFPYLDHRLIEFAARIPTGLLIGGLDEKHVLKRAVRHLLPNAVIGRTKQPYRAPIRRSFFGSSEPEWVHEVLAPAAVEDAAVFDPGAVGRLCDKARGPYPLSERDEMGIAGVLSTQLLIRQFLHDGVKGRTTPATLDRFVDRRSDAR